MRFVAKLRNRNKRQDPLAQAEQRLADQRAKLERARAAKPLQQVSAAALAQVGATGKAASAAFAKLAQQIDAQCAAAMRVPPPSFPATPKRPQPKSRPEPVKRTGKALGFRSWKLEGYSLKSANEHFGGWKVDEPTEAVCKGGGGAASLRWLQQVYGLTPNQLRTHYGINVPDEEPPPTHDAPHPDCQCGLYALHAPEFMSRWHQGEPLMVHGAVLGWGRMEVHHEGFRAQYAQPVMLTFDGDRQPYNHCERVKAMGEELGLPVVEWAEFEAEARKLAEPVPEELRPDAVDAAVHARGGYIGGSLGAGTSLQFTTPAVHWGYGVSPYPQQQRSYFCAYCGMTQVMTGGGHPGPPCTSCGK